jgi:hypothetical protein
VNAGGGGKVPGGGRGREGAGRREGAKAVNIFSKNLIKLKSAKDVPELIKIADSLKITNASSGVVKFLEGNSEIAKEVFESVTKGWRENITIKDGKTIIVKFSPDGSFTLNYRTKSTTPPIGSAKSIEATIDVIQKIPNRGLITEIKFGSLK